MDRALDSKLPHSGRKVDSLAKAVELKPEEKIARAYADRLILGKLTELHAAVKLSEIADKLQADGIGLAAIRSLLASNPEKFAYSERRWIPAARIEGEGRPFHEAVRLVVDRFGGPMPVSLLASELTHARGSDDVDAMAEQVRDMVNADATMFLTNRDEVALASWVFAGSTETVERALGLNRVSGEEFEAAKAKLGSINWRAEDAVAQALKAAVPMSARAIGAAAWSVLNPQAAHAPQLFDWKEFNAALLSVPGYVFGADGMMTAEADAKKWISAAVKLAERIAPTVEIEDAAPIEIKAADIDRMVAKILASDESTTATRLLEEFYEITPSVKTFPDDLANVLAGLKSSGKVAWVGGDRFQKPGQEPDFVHDIPELFQYLPTEFTDDEGELIDVELTDEGLSSTLRKLLVHPLATDVLDEDILPAPKQYQDTIRLVLKPIHRELGTFPLCQVPTGWLDSEPKLQELLLIDPTGREISAWANIEARLVFNLLDWFFEQPVESGAVFSLTKTAKPNVFEFQWLDQADPVVFVTHQRMEELREIAARAETMSTLELLQEVMSHWPKGADFLTILWELNVIRRSSRRLVASLLSSYACFYQRSGSPVWHYDSKKVEQGFDKTKRKFVIKR